MAQHNIFVKGILQHYNTSRAHLISTNESENLTVSLRESPREPMFELQLNSPRKVSQSQAALPPTSTRT